MKSLPVPTLEISESPLSLEAAYRALADPRAGGVAVFVGRVRDENSGKVVRALHYAAHPTAIERLKVVADVVMARFEPFQLVAIHRAGDLAIGEIAVICGVATKHRDDAFAACQMLIDTLKAEVPIWKEEFYTDGTEHWVGTP